MFVPTNGVCGVITMLIEQRDGMPVGVPLRLQMSLAAGESAQLGSADGARLKLTCGAGAGTLAVESSGPELRFAGALQ